MSKITRTTPTDVEESGTTRGRRVLRARYPSSRPGVLPHITYAKDDGTPLDCTCPGYMTGRCWHTDADGAAAIVVAYWRGYWDTAPLETLVWREGELRHWLGLGPDQADADAARLEWSALGDLIGERTATAAA